MERLSVEFPQGVVKWFACDKVVLNLAALSLTGYRGALRSGDMTRHQTHQVGPWVGLFLRGIIMEPAHEEQDGYLTAVNRCSGKELVLWSEEQVRQVLNKTSAWNRTPTRRNQEHQPLEGSMEAVGEEPNLVIKCTSNKGG